MSLCVDVDAQERKKTRTHKRTCHTKRIWWKRWYVSIFNFSEHLFFRLLFIFKKMRVIHIPTRLFTVSKKVIHMNVFFFHCRECGVLLLCTFRRSNIRKMSDLRYFIHIGMNSGRFFSHLLSSNCLKEIASDFRFRITLWYSFCIANNMQSNEDTLVAIRAMGMS